MLHPKTGIFVVYGHDLELKNDTLNAIEELAAEGYRVRPIILDDRVNITSDSNFRNNLKSRLDEAQGAVVLLSPDDYGIASKLVGEDEVIAKSEMEARPRQNVVWEYGYLDSKLSTREYIVLTRPTASELFSDTSGLFVGRVADQKEVRACVRDFIVERLNTVKNPNPLTDSDFRIDYSNLFYADEPSDAKAIEIFDRQFSQLDNDDDRTLFLLERIVFDIYSHSPGWWQEAVKLTKPVTNLLKLMQDLLLFVRRYMEAWNNPLIIDRIAVATIRDMISSIQTRLSDFQNAIAPVVPIVFHDYAGLTLHKVGIAKSQRDEIEGSISDFEEAAHHFGIVLDIAQRYESIDLPLWQGYAAFNRARVYRQLYNLEPRKYPEHLWAQAYGVAIGHRSLWKRENLLSFNFPARLRDGLEAEYIHVLVSRRKDALRDKKGRIIEQSEYRVDNDFDERVRREYNAWLTQPEQDRVRLAGAIRANYDDVTVNGASFADRIRNLWT